MTSLNCITFMCPADPGNVFLVSASCVSARSTDPQENFLQPQEVLVLCLMGDVERWTEVCRLLQRPWTGALR